MLLLTKLLFSFGLATNHFELENIPSQERYCDVLSDYSMLNSANELYKEDYFFNSKQVFVVSPGLVVSRQEQQRPYSKKI